MQEFLDDFFWLFLEWWGVAQETVITLICFIRQMAAVFSMEV